MNRLFIEFIQKSKDKRGKKGTRELKEGGG